MVTSGKGRQLFTVVVLLLLQSSRCAVLLLGCRPAP